MHPVCDRCYTQLSATNRGNPINGQIWCDACVASLGARCDRCDAGVVSTAPGVGVTDIDGTYHQFHQQCLPDRYKLQVSDSVPTSADAPVENSAERMVALMGEARPVPEDEVVFVPRHVDRVDHPELYLTLVELRRLVDSARAGVGWSAWAAAVRTVRDRLPERLPTLDEDLATIRYLLPNLLPAERAAVERLVEARR